jgi:hypothetical protein
MPRHLQTLIRQFVGSLRDLAPIMLVIVFFQTLVLRQPLPDLENVVVGLTLFVQGLETGLFPLGGTMAVAFARKGSVVALLLFAFCLGFGTTVAEPALIAVAGKAAEVAGAEGLIGDSAEAMAGYAFRLRLTVALAVGVALVVGVFRIVKGWPIHYLIIGGYLLVVVMTYFAPAEFVGVAYDSGGVTTSTITVPLVAALGVGLSTAIRGRNPMVDGFGLIAFASLTPMIFVLIFAMTL